MPTFTPSRLAAGVLSVALAGLPLGTAAPAWAGDAACEPVVLEVTSGTIAGEFCDSAGEPSTLLITVSGATYGRAYWDLPYQPESYSFTDAFTAHGYPVLNIDRLGVGASTRPAGLSVTVDLGARALHEVVQAARAGLAGSSPFERVVLVGHSLGSVLAMTEAATYHDIDALVVTGLVHDLNDLAFAVALTTFYPAPLDPRFAGQLTDVGYLTTLPGTRGGTHFFYSPNADPGVIAADDASKETIALGEVATLTSFVLPGLLNGPNLCGLLPVLCHVAPGLLVGLSREVTVPVLSVVGQRDTLMCGGLGSDCSSSAALDAAERGYWRGAPCFEAAVVPDAAHNLNLHRNAHVWYGLAANWLDALSRDPAGGFGCALDQHG